MGSHLLRTPAVTNPQEAAMDKTRSADLTSPVLRGHIVLSRTVPMGPYNSFRVEVMEEYVVAPGAFAAKFDEPTDRLRGKLIQAGIVKT